MKIHVIIFVGYFLLPMLQAQIAPPKIEEIQRIRLNAVRVKWSAPSDSSYTFTRNRVILFDGTSSIEWPSQAIRVNKDGDDALELEVLPTSSYLDCIKLCLANPKCRYIVKSGQKCFLKAGIPNSGPCAPLDECAEVLAYTNEASLYELPMNKTFRLQLQLYDSKSKTWSTSSQLSNVFSTDYVKPQIVTPIEQVNPNTIRLKWNIIEESIIKPIRYRISLYRKAFGDVREWPAQMQVSDIDGSAFEYNKFPSDSKSAIECTNACLRDSKCLLAVKDKGYCYLKDLPVNLGTCAVNNGCWVLKGYQSVANLTNLPYDEIYKFQVTVFDQFSQEWSLPSDFSEDFNTKINIMIMPEKIDEFSYRILIKQENYYPVVRMRVMVSKNDSTFTYDLKSENDIKRSTLARYETLFNDFSATNLGNIDESRCLQYCFDDYKCVGVKIKDGNCLTTDKFDPFSADICLPFEKCYSITNVGNYTVLQNLDASTNYKVKIEYLTKFNTRGFSNTVEFGTVNFHVNITSSNLQQSESGTLKCKTLEDSLVSGIVWYKDDTIIDQNNKLNITVDNAAKSLIFSNLSRTLHNGQYKCSVQISINNQILNSTAFNLFVKYGPIYTNKYANQSTFQYNISDSAKFFCEVEGYGPFRFGWKYNNDESRGLDIYTNYSNQTFKYYSELNFKNISRRDNGSYSCLVETTIITTIYLFVPSVPSKPRLTNLLFINKSSIFVNWQFDDNGDYPIEKISIESQNGNANPEYLERDVVITKNFNGTILNLQLPDNAIVRIRLKNSLGYGPLSEPVKYSMPPQKEEGLSTTELIVAIVVPVVVVLIILIIVVAYYRKRCSRTTKI